MNQILGKGFTSLARLSGAALVILLTPGVSKATHIGVGVFTDTPGSEQTTLCKAVNCSLSTPTVNPSLDTTKTQEDFHSINDNKYPVIGLTYSTTDPNLIFDASLSSSNLFSNVKVNPDNTVVVSGGKILPGQNFLISRFYSQPTGPSSTYAITVIFGVPEPSSLLPLLAVGALGTISLLKRNANSKFKEK